MHGHRKLVELLLGRSGEAAGSGAAGADASGSGSGSGSDAGGGSAVDDYMASSKDALREREAKVGCCGCCLKFAAPTAHLY